MEIGNFQPFYAQNYDPSRFKAPAGQEPGKQSSPGVIVDISPEGREASKRISELFEDQECETCKNRKYKDVSDDPSVSFQSPTHINPNAAASVVAAHENEHVTNEKAEAEREGRKIVSQTVTLKTGICPECHRMYVAGGVTRTTSVKSSEPPEPSIDLEA
jgi:hypothetical protein